MWRDGVRLDDNSPSAWRRAKWAGLAPGWGVALRYPQDTPCKNVEPSSLRMRHNPRTVSRSYVVSFSKTLAFWRRPPQPEPLPKMAAAPVQTRFFRDGVTGLESPIEIMTQINQKDTKTNSGNDTSRFKSRKNGFGPTEAVTSLLLRGRVVAEEMAQIESRKRYFPNNGFLC